MSSRHAELNQILSHRPPFRFVHDILQNNAEAGSFVLDLAQVHMWLINAQLPSCFLIEALAQATAAFFGLQQTAHQERGLLVEIQHAEFTANAALGSPVVLHVRLDRIFGQFARIIGSATQNQKALAKVVLTVARTQQEAA